MKSAASEPGFTKIVEIKKKKKLSAMNTRIDNFYYVRFFCPTNAKVCPKMADILNKVN